MKVTPEAVRMARSRGDSPLRLQRVLDAFERFLEDGDFRPLLEQWNLEKPPEAKG